MADKMIPKVVPIKSFMKPSKAVKLLQECSGLAAEGLSKSLATMMGQVDDALFELAEKAESNVVQTLYFDAMREVRLKRKDMEAIFSDRFQKDCIGIIENDAAAADTVQGDLPLEGELMLVEDNHLETSLAITNMVSKVHHLCKEELFALDTRVGLLLNKPELAEEANPFNPMLICNAFKEACNELETDIKVKLIILKLFEKFVVPDLRHVYQQLNEHLAQNNILPRIDYAIQRTPGAPGAHHYEGFVATEMKGDTEDMDHFATIQQLLTQRQSMNPGAVYGSSGGTAPLPATRLLNNLTQLQHGDMELLASAGADVSLLGSGTTNMLRQLKDHQVLGVLAQEQDQTIDIVAMLFDYILEDKNIPDRMQAVIGRLQIPILKVVMLDKSFFSRKNHPARKFLDTLSQAAIGFSEDKDAEDLYLTADSLVQRVISEFEDDVDIFAEVLAELEAHLEELEQRASEDLERLQQEAAEQEQLERARLKAAEEVRARLEQSDLNEIVQEFLSEHWKTLLMMTFLMEGDESDAWISGVETMDNLIWSIAPKKTQEERKQLVAALPSLLESLQQGMNLVEMPLEEKERFFSRLARCHSEAVSSRNNRISAAEGEEYQDDIDVGQAPVQAAAPQTDTDEAQECPPEQCADETVSSSLENPGDDMAYAGRGRVQEPGEGTALAAMKKMAGLRAAEILAQIEQGTLEVEEITLSNTQGGGMVNEIEDEYTRMAQEMENGTWIAFAQGNGSISQEKLTWINTTTGIYMFTNRNGKNTRNLTFYQFAEELRKGKAEVVADTPLVDRAMNSLIDGLSNCH